MHAPQPAQDAASSSGTATLPARNLNRIALVSQASPQERHSTCPNATHAAPISALLNHAAPSRLNATRPDKSPQRNCLRVTCIELPRQFQGCFGLYL
jgi:hypothetical protein